MIQFEAGFEKTISNHGDLNSALIPEEKLVLMEEIGRGHQSKVLKGKFFYGPKDKTYMTVAVKQLINKHNLKIEDFNERIAEETSFYLNLIHPHIIRMFGMVKRMNNINLMVMEFAPGSCLLHFLETDFGQEVNIADTVLIDWALQIVDAMLYLHQNKIIHCDLKCRNVLLDTMAHNMEQLKKAKLKVINVSWMNAMTTPSHTAPEVMKNFMCRKSDVWAFGVVLWELQYKKKPFEDLESLQILYKVGLKKETLKVDDHVNPKLAKLMKSCWAYNSEDRPDFEQIRDELINIKQTVNSI